MRGRQRSPEEKKRLFEILAIFLIWLLLVMLSRAEGNLFELSEKLSSNREFFDSVVYFGLINLNVILILLLSFLIFRNVVKLVVERRRGVLGSKLRTKLVVSLVFFALAPTTLMFYISSRYLTDSFETWFSSRVQSTMDKTKEASSLVYRREERRLESLARIALQRIVVERDEAFLGSVNMRIIPAGLSGFDAEYRLDVVNVYNLSGVLIWSSSGLSIESQASESRDAFVSSTLERFRLNPGMTSRGAIKVEEGRDVVKGAAPIHDPISGALVGMLMTEEQFETQIIRSVEAILKEFANLRPSAQLMRMSYNILLVVMVLIIIFSATWFGFYVARAIIGPIQSLAEATKEVALGNYQISLQPKANDETGQLVRSFNQMTRDLRVNQERVKEFTKKLEANNVELDSRRRYMEFVLGSVSAGVVAVDGRGVVTSINDSAISIFEIKDAKIGINVDALLGPYLFENFWLPIQEGLRDRQAYSGQVSLPDLNIDLSVDANRILGENGVDLGYVFVFTDASEKVKAQKIVAWREVAQRIAHEIKNPITPIKLSAQRLLRRFGGEFSGGDREVFVTCVETIVSEVDSLRDLVNEFSKFSRLPAIRSKQENINELIKETYSLYSMSYSDITFDISGLSDSLPPCMIDKEQMGRVLSNLVVNAEAAIRESSRAGVITFSTEALPGYDTIRIVVTDNGLGIPKRLKSRVLEPYFSTKKDGSGLGLAIVNQIISDHRGYLRLLDNSPFGTKIVIELPLGEKREEALHR